MRRILYGTRRSRGTTLINVSSRRSARSVCEPRWRFLKYRGRQVGKKLARRRERLRFAGDDIVHHAVLAVDVGAAEPFLVDVLADGFRHRRSGDEHLAQALNHDAVVAGRHPARAQACARPQRKRHHRHGRHVRHHPFPARRLRNVGARILLQHLHRAAAAGPVDEANERHAIFVGHLLGEHELLPNGGIAGAAAHGEVVRLHRDRAAFDQAAADHERCGAERRQFIVGAVFGFAGDLAGLVECCPHREAHPRVRAP